MLRDVLSWLTAFSWNTSLWRLFLLHALPCRGCIDFQLHQKPVSVFPSSCVMPGGDHALGCVWISRTLLDPLAFLWTFTTSSDSQFFKAGCHNCCVLSCLWLLTSLTSPTASPTRLAEVCTLLCSQYYLIYSTNQNNWIIFCSACVINKDEVELFNSSGCFQLRGTNKVDFLIRCVFRMECWEESHKMFFLTKCVLLFTSPDQWKHLWNNNKNPPGSETQWAYYIWCAFKPEAVLSGSDRLHSVVEEVVEDGNIFKDNRMSQ